MCGIFGVAFGRDNAAEEVYAGLERLEYRGYDSAGLSVLGGDGHISTVKAGGRVGTIKERALTLCGSVAIGHVRWATHGAPTDYNAHPHVSGRFSLVHNGMIENFLELKDELISKGASFSSDTDTEVIVKLIDMLHGDGEASEESILNALSKAVARLKGSYALGVLCEGVDGIAAVKYKSPIVVGFFNGGIALCSDIPALPEGVESVCVPDDGDIVWINKHSATFYDGNLRSVNRVRRPIFAGQCAKGKGNWAHYMIKEINESERTLHDTCESFFRNTDVKRLGEYVRGADRIIITGCGTAYNAGLAARRFFEDKCGVYCQVEIASELRYSPVKVTPATLVLAVSQSGETADTVEAVVNMKSEGAKIVAVTNCGYSQLTRVAHLVVPVCAGAEVCVAATKSYIGQVAALYLISRLSDDVFAACEKLDYVKEHIKEVLDGGEKAKEIARICADSSAVFFLGRGADYPAAVEASLKLKEVSYIFSDGYPAGELKHGTLALVDGNTLSVFIICDESLAKKTLGGVSQVLSRGGKAAVITNVAGVAEEIKGRATVWEIPVCEAQLSPILAAIALQLIAYHTATILGRDPDKPRNLAKSVTVE